MSWLVQITTVTVATMMMAMMPAVVLTMMSLLLFLRPSHHAVVLRLGDESGKEGSRHPKVVVVCRSEMRAVEMKVMTMEGGGENVKAHGMVRPCDWGVTVIRRHRWKSASISTSGAHPPSRSSSQSSVRPQRAVR